MGNLLNRFRVNNDEIHENGLDQNENLLQVNPNNNQNNDNQEQATYKKVLSIRLPVYLQKESLSLKRDAVSPNIHYISFNYDSLYDINCHINFDVTENTSKKKINNSYNYLLSYIPSNNFENDSIYMPNQPKGQNIEFLNKSVFINIENFNNNKLQSINNNNNNKYDLSIELVPLIENNNKHISFITLCKINTEIHNDFHTTYTIKCIMQRIKIYDKFIDLYEIYNMTMDNDICLICCSNKRNTILIPCKHACCCNYCGLQIKLRNKPCPICKTPIEDLLIVNNGDNQIEGDIIDVDEEPKKNKEVNNNEENNIINDIECIHADGINYNINNFNDDDHNINNDININLNFNEIND